MKSWWAWHIHCWLLLLTLKHVNSSWLSAFTTYLTPYVQQLQNPFMGYAKFRAAFFGDSSNEWSVTPSDGFLKQNEATHFVVRYNPHSPGVSNVYFVIETEVSESHHRSIFWDCFCARLNEPLCLLSYDRAITGLQEDLEDCWEHWRKLENMSFELSGAVIKAEQ